MTDTPNGAPPPTPDLERQPRTHVTRLPYLAIVLVALIVVGVFGALTWRERETAHQEMIGLDATPVAGQVAKAPAR